MSNPSTGPTPQEIYDTSYALGLEEVQKGIPIKAIEKQMLDRGLHPEMAAAVASDLRVALEREIVRAGRKNLLYGMLWFLGGAGLTGLTYLSARDGGSGGRFAVFYGAILYGIYRMFRGLMQASTGKR